MKRFRTKGTLLGLSAAAAAIAVVLALLGTGCFGMFGCGLMCGACGAACSDSCSELTGESCFDPDAFRPDATAEPAWDGPGSIRTTPQREIELTAALDSVRQKSGMMGVRLNGVMYDMGNPKALRRCILQFPE